MEILNHDELIKIRNDHAKTQNQAFNRSFIISEKSVEGRNYKKGIDKDNFLPYERAIMDDIKDRLTYSPDEADPFFS